MRTYLLLFVLLPFTGMAQVKSKSKGKTANQPAATVNAAGNFTIQGTISGYPDGTVVDLLNGNNGNPEATTKLESGRFTFSGKQDFPDFKLISVNKVPPYITLFLDNSIVNITAAKDALDQAVITGSASHNDFIAYNTMAKPYDKLFSGEVASDPETVKKVAWLMEDFARNKKSSHISLLAIYRNNQLTSNSDLMEELFMKLDPGVRVSPMGNYIAQQIEEAKKLPIGKPLADFAQDDTLGVSVKLSSLRGKYVLVDFWASWCGPCRQENPNVVEAFQKYKSKNFTVLGVSLDKSKQPWLDAIKADNLTWTHVSDLLGWKNSVAQQFEIFSIPQNFLIDPNGILIAKNLRGAALQSKLAALLK